MPSPIIHVSAGLAGGYFLKRSVSPDANPWSIFAFSLFFSILPDADVFVGLIAGDLGRYHNQLTHSPLAGLFFCCLLAWPWRYVLKDKNYIYLASRATLLYMIHLALDYLTYGRGLKLLWPFSDERFISPLQPFIGVRWSEGLFAVDHLQTAVNEFAILLLVTGAYILARKFVFYRRKAVSGEGKS